VVRRSLFLWVGRSMTSHGFNDRLQNLGWRSIKDGRQAGGCWCVFAVSCGQAILAFANSRQEAWDAVCSMALRVTREELTKT
jgi:hypothetical protein